MAFILGVTGKLLSNHTADLQQILGFQIQPWDIQNDLESVWKCFNIGKILNFEKNITWDDYSGIFGKILISGFQAFIGN